MDTIMPGIFIIIFAVLGTKVASEIFDGDSSEEKCPNCGNKKNIGYYDDGDRGKAHQNHSCTCGKCGCDW